MPSLTCISFQLQSRFKFHYRAEDIIQKQMLKCHEKQLCYRINELLYSIKKKLDRLNNRCPIQHF